METSLSWIVWALIPAVWGALAGSIGHYFGHKRGYKLGWHESATRSKNAILKDMLGRG